MRFSNFYFTENLKNSQFAQRYVKRVTTCSFSFFFVRADDVIIFRATSTNLNGFNSAILLFSVLCLFRLLCSEL